MTPRSETVHQPINFSNMPGFNTPPVLMWMPEYESYALRVPGRNADLDDDRRWYMLIDKSWNGETWYHYRYLCEYGDDDTMELITKADYDERVQSIRDHEGDLVADTWHRVQDVYMVERDRHPVFALRKHWEAMMQLGLIELPVSHRSKAIRAMGAEAVLALQKAREQVMEMDSRELDPDEPLIHPTFGEV